MADKDFVVKNGLVVNTSVLVANGTKVGVNTASPDAALTVVGTANVQGNVTITGAEMNVTSNVTMYGNVHVKNNAYIDQTLYVGNTETMVQDLPTIMQAVDNFNGFVMISSQNLSKEDDACADMLIYADDTNGLSNFNDLGINNSRFDGRIHRIVANAVAGNWQLGETVYQRNGAGANIAVGQIRDILTINATAVSLKIRVTEDDGLPTYVGMSNFSNTTGSNLSLRAETSGTNADIMAAVAFFSPEANTVSRRNFAFTVAKNGDGYLYNANSALTIGTTAGGIRTTTYTIDTSFISGTNTIILTTGNTSALKPDLLVFGTGIPVDTYITSITNSTSFKLSKVTTAPSSGGLTARSEFYDANELNNPIIFHTGGMMAKNEVARITGNGNFVVGPNTTSRAAKLNINGSANIVGVINAGANLNVTGNVVTSANIGAVSGVFSVSVNVGSQVSLATGGFLSGNVSADFNTIKIAGNPVISSVNVAAGNLTIGNTSVTNAPLIRLVNSSASANLTTMGMQVGDTIVNSSGLAVGANVSVNTSTIFIGNASANVVINPALPQAVAIVGNASIVGNLSVTGSLLVSGPTVSVGTQTSTGDFNPNGNNAYNLGNVTNHWGNASIYYVRIPEQGFQLVGNSTQNVVTTFGAIRLSNTTAGANISPVGIVTGTAVVNTTTISIGNAALTTAVSMSVANTGGTTTINPASISTTSISGNLTGNVTSTFVSASANVTVGANVLMNTSVLAIGNASANIIANSTMLMGNTTGVHTGNVVAATLSGNLTGNVAATIISGNLTGNVTSTFVSASANVTIGSNLLINSTSVVVGNTSLTTFAPQVIVANNSGVTTINATSVSTNNLSGNLTGNVVATTISGNLAGNVVATTISGNLTGNVIATTVNATTINAATFQVGSSFTANASGIVTGNAIINGNLTVLGTTTTMNSTVLDVQDLNITVAKGVASAAAATGAGLTVDVANATILYVNVSNTWISNINFTVGNSSVNVYTNSTSFIGNTIGSHVGNVTGNVAATTLSASANINLGATLIANTSGVYSTHLGGQPASSYFLGTENRTLSGNLYFTGANDVFQNMLTLASGAGGASNTSAALWVNASGGAIALDTNMNKRISWNDGAGNFTLRGGHYWNTSVSNNVYQSDGAATVGAASIILNTDGVDGSITLYTAPLGTTGTNAVFNTYMQLSTSALSVVGANLVVTSNASLSDSLIVGSRFLANGSVANATHLAGIVGSSYYRAGSTDVALADGGTNASLTAVAGGITYSTTTGLAISAVGTSGWILASNSTNAPYWRDPSTLSVASATSATTATSASSATTATTATTATNQSGGTVSATTGSFSGRVSASASQSVGSMLNAGGSLGGIELYGGGGSNAAFMSFHRPGAYASYFGLDNDNQFAVGGWSAGAGLAYMKVLGLGVGTAAVSGGAIHATGDITAFYSDARLKTDIKKIENALSKVKSISGITYINNDLAKSFGYDNENRMAGVLAQEIEAVLPEVVTLAPFDIDKDSDGNIVSKSGENYRTVKYDKIVPLLIEAIKELGDKVDSLQNELAELKK